MTFWRTLFMWTGVVTWLCFAVMAVVFIVEWTAWRRIQPPDVYDLDNDWDDEDDDLGWDGWASWPRSDGAA